MKRYRFSVGAVVYFDVEATNLTDAQLRAANQLLKTEAFPINELSYGEARPIHNSSIVLENIDAMLK